MRTELTTSFTEENRSKSFVAQFQNVTSDEEYVNIFQTRTYDYVSLKLQAEQTKKDSDDFVVQW